MAERNKKKNPHYVNNKDFLAAMVEFRDSVIEAEKAGKPRPMVPVYVADCIMKIATHLSYKPNFVNYTFREDMICDGIENCLQYIDNFNPDKSNNPFAYFTQIVYYAFLRRIQKEKKYLYTKYKASENANLFEGTSDSQEHDREVDFNDQIKYNDWTQEHMSDFIRNFEECKRKKKRKVVHED